MMKSKGNVSFFEPSVYTLADGSTNGSIFNPIFNSYTRKYEPGIHLIHRVTNEICLAAGMRPARINVPITSRTATHSNALTYRRQGYRV